MSLGIRREHTVLAARGHDTIPGRTAREWFDYLVPLRRERLATVGHFANAVGLNSEGKWVHA